MTTDEYLARLASMMRVLRIDPHDATTRLVMADFVEEHHPSGAPDLVRATLTGPLRETGRRARIVMGSLDVELRAWLRCHLSLVRDEGRHYRLDAEWQYGATLADFNALWTEGARLAKIIARLDTPGVPDAHGRPSGWASVEVGVECLAVREGRLARRRSAKVRVAGGGVR